jgi:hypothetical protein
MTPSQLFATLLALVKGTFGKALIGPVVNFLNAFMAAPPVDTVQGQAVLISAAGQLQFALVQSLASAEPAFVQAEQAAIAKALIAELQDFEAKLLGAPAPAPPTT